MGDEVFLFLKNVDNVINYYLNEIFIILFVYLVMIGKLVIYGYKELFGYSVVVK